LDKVALYVNDKLVFGSDVNEPKSINEAILSLKNRFPNPPNFLGPEKPQQVLTLSDKAKLFEHDLYRYFHQ
jgi:hypothetical protein